ncbi:IS200/IS605 family transposase [Pectinatus brassicae]|uniref:IS200/IS605 family transposase n=1 Tax=Pectinatus brassicae TaxID=862415 RepID=UPI0018C4FE52|nr:IS200/IS605 family transposase [Pectinatus brassicae]
MSKQKNNDTHSLAHTKWNCKYHIVFAPKYRRKVFYKEKRQELRDIMRTLCEWKGVEIIEGEICPDHIHLLVCIPPKISVSGFMGYLKGKSSLIIFQKFGNMKFAYRNREFWCKGYYVDTVGKDTKAITEYIANQLKRDKEADQLSLFDPRDPFTGSK